MKVSDIADHDAGKYAGTNVNNISCECKYIALSPKWCMNYLSYNAIDGINNFNASLSLSVTNIILYDNKLLKCLPITLIWIFSFPFPVGIPNDAVRKARIRCPGPG